MLKESKYPILEYDSTKEPFIKPTDTVVPIQISEKCVLCFFSKSIKKVLNKYPNKVVAMLRNEGFATHIYEVDYNGTQIILVQAYVGAPLAATQLEELTAMGCKKYICCGSCGALSGDLEAGSIIIPTSAIRDEGTSYHYADPDREANANPRITAILEETLTEADIPYLTGKTWTTDALYRETPDKINKRREEGCIIVDMEASANMIVADYLGIDIGHLFYAGDSLSGEEWDYRDYLEKHEERDLLLKLSLEACSKL